ncbi:hypothetical protein [Caloramator australicus]|uniref:Uncharacterized protein n=1 Tax=Caloramator australicus RC3 TaxID=857293 RepID=I7K682_9CLOT|nr:hypothetical protein [Caloramator australicus]CCJ33069.1 hypothetical protein CAAU_0985 [Caloramator australicus RC3]
MKKILAVVLIAVTVMAGIALGSFYYINKKFMFHLLKIFLSITMDKVPILIIMKRRVFLIYC